MIEFSVLSPQLPAADSATPHLPSQCVRIFITIRARTRKNRQDSANEINRDIVLISNDRQRKEHGLHAVGQITMSEHAHSIRVVICPQDIAI